jgi:hypothetical protein
LVELCSVARGLVMSGSLERVRLAAG